MHNYYAFLYNKVTFETVEKRLGKDQAIVFARSATAGGQRFPVHWGGDPMSTFEAMAETLRGGMSLGLCGFGYWARKSLKISPYPLNKDQLMILVTDDIGKEKHSCTKLPPGQNLIRSYRWFRGKTRPCLV